MDSSQTPAVIRKAVVALRQEETKFTTEVRRYSTDPQPGCPFLVDRDVAWKSAHHKYRTSRQKLWKETIRHAELMSENVVDHVRAVRRLLAVEDSSESPPLFAHMTAMRVACEAAAQIAYLYDSSVSYEQRLLRGAVLLRDNAAHSAKAANTVPSALSPLVQPGVAAAQRLPAKIADQITKAGIVEVLGGRGKTVTRLEIPNGAKEPAIVQKSTLIKSAFADRPGLFNYGSGVAHSMQWMLGDAVVERVGTQTRLAPDVIGIGAATLSCIEACGVVAATFAAYFGHDPLRAERSRQTRHQALTVWMQQHMVTTSHGAV
ncbi:hypothetical protein [Pilimelia columellifera]|uniref:Uncharacterized protein n=1 Tax=Pilimelia columellifera subsp. columellifera TaxID=706583 RepID=A0ABP6B2B5_9ACTN